MFNKFEYEYQVFLKSNIAKDFDNNPTPFDFFKRCYPEIGYPLLEWNDSLKCKFKLSDISMGNLEALIVLSGVKVN